MKYYTEFSFLVLVAYFVTGCAGPQATRDTANTLALYTTELKAQTEEFASRRTAILQIRSSALNTLSDSATESENDTALKLQILSLSGDSESPKLINALIAQADLAEKNQETNNLVKEQENTAIRSEKTGFDSQSANLATVQKNLAILAENPSLQEQLTFMAGFVSSVRNDINAAQTNALQQSIMATNEAAMKQ